MNVRSWILTMVRNRWYSPGVWLHQCVQIGLLSTSKSHREAGEDTQHGAIHVLPAAVQKCHHHSL